MSTIAGFFSMDPGAVGAAMALLSGGASSGAVTTRDTMRPTRDGLVNVPGGILDDAIFGTTELDHRELFGHVEVSGLVHPLALRIGNGRLSSSELRSVALGEIAIRDGVLVLPSPNPREDELVGPSGVTAWLRAVDPSHPALEFCDLTTVPVLPRATRPLVHDGSPTMVDPWVGPRNEHYLAFVERALRQTKMRALTAPEVIRANAERQAQRALFALFDLLAVPTLAPPLEQIPEHLTADDALAIAWAGNTLVVQQRDHVSVLERDGTIRLRVAPSPCRLRGVHGDGLVVFEQRFEARGIPYRAGQIDASVLDLRAGEYLANLPADLGLAFASEGGHGELDLLSIVDGEGARWDPFRYGDHAEVLLAYSNDLRFAWGGDPGVGSAIVERMTSIPHALPFEPPGYETDEVRGPDELDAASEIRGAAFGFSQAGWRLLWPNGVLSDLRGADAVQLPFDVRAAAFAPDGETLAVVVDHEILLLAANGGTVHTRMPLPR